MIKVLINGLNGRMGQEVLRQIENNENFSVLCGVDINDANMNRNPSIFGY